jgi:hypothetical protein
MYQTEFVSACSFATSDDRNNSRRMQVVEKTAIYTTCNNAITTIHQTYTRMVLNGNKSEIEDTMILVNGSANVRPAEVPSLFCLTRRHGDHARLRTSTMSVSRCWTHDAKVWIAHRRLRSISFQVWLHFCRCVANPGILLRCSTRHATFAERWIRRVALHVPSVFTPLSNITNRKNRQYIIYYYFYLILFDS